jgi:hypothetical protein
MSVANFFAVLTLFRAGVCSVWSSWGSWTDCSRSCGPGTKRRERSCSTEGSVRSGPVPPCPGDRVQDLSCELQSCAGPGQLLLLFSSSCFFNFFKFSAPSRHYSYFSLSKCLLLIYICNMPGILVHSFCPKCYN